MPTQTFTFRVAVTVDTPENLNLDLQLGDLVLHPTPAHPNDPTPGPDLAAEAMAVIDNGDPGTAQFREAYIRRCITELGLHIGRPRTGDRTYINLLPPGASRGRVASLAPSGRAAIMAPPEEADGFETAVPLLNDGVPVRVKVYLTSEQAVDDAVELTKIAASKRR